MNPLLDRGALLLADRISKQGFIDRNFLFALGLRSPSLGPRIDPSYHENEKRISLPRTEINRMNPGCSKIREAEPSGPVNER